MSLDAVPSKREYEECEACHGRGVLSCGMVFRSQHDALCLDEEHRCEECSGEGTIYVGPSDDQEDYVEHQEGE